MFGLPSVSEFLNSTSFTGTGDLDTVENATNQEWSAQTARYQTAMRYFGGSVFEDRADSGEPGDPSPLLYPLAINLVKMMCLSQAGSLWGQWDDELLTWDCDPLSSSESAKQRAAQAQKVIAETMEASRMGSRLLEAGINQQVYGGTYLRAAVDAGMPHGVRVDKLMPYNVFPRWHPINVDRILEAWIVVPIDKAEAILAYGVNLDSLPDETVYVEHWTEDEYETLIGEVRLTDFSGKNPWGFVPIEYVPRVRQEGFYGLPLSEDIMGLQDELNARLADMGDNINNAAHPIRWIRNYRGDPRTDFEMGADALWNLGQSIAGQDPPEAGVLPAQPEPRSSFDFINFLVDVSRNVAGTSPVAFGEDEGSQRSGVTLVLRLWPLIQQAKATRLFWRDGLNSLNRKILQMVTFRDTAGVYEKLAEHVVVPNFAELVPQDRQLLIEEIIKRAQENLISPQEAIAHFGVKAGTDEDELKRIVDWVEFLNDLEIKKAEAQAKQFDQQNSDGGNDETSS
jgi:hypothetical protein